MTNYYVDFGYIELMLKNRLRVVQTPATSLLPSITSMNNVSQSPDPALVEIFIDERQAYIDSYLDQKYVLPLQLIHPRTVSMLRKCAGGFVIYDIMANFFFGQGIAFLDPTSPDTGFGVQKRSESQRMLDSFVFQDVVAESGGGITYRGDKLEVKRVELPGELIRSIAQEGPIANRTILHGIQNGSTDYLLEQNPSNNIFS